MLIILTILLILGLWFDFKTIFYFASKAEMFETAPAAAAMFRAILSVIFRLTIYIGFLWLLNRAADCLIYTPIIATT